jgi:hypothetical protein
MLVSVEVMNTIKWHLCNRFQVGAVYSTETLVTVGLYGATSWKTQF